MKMNHGKAIYMLVEDDIYELPLAIADTPGELAEIIGIDKQKIFEEMSKAKRKGLWCRFVKVSLDGTFHLPQYGKREKKQTGVKGQKVIHFDGVKVVEYNSAVIAAAELGVNVSTIRRWIKERNDWTYETISS